MDKFVDSLFKEKSTPIVRTSSNTDKVINEAIVLDTLGGSHKDLTTFFEAIGAYGSRDGLLSECPTFTDPTNCNHAEIAAILACAKDANSPDYAIYMKAIEVQKAYLEKMRQTFGNLAKIKIEEQKKKLDDNARVQDAIAQTTNSTGESCCK